MKKAVSTLVLVVFLAAPSFAVTRQREQPSPRSAIGKIVKAIRHLLLPAPNDDISVPKP